MGSIFSKIIAGEIPCYKIAEDAAHLAFLDIRPLTKGHTLVIPKEEVDYIFDLNPNALANLHLFAQKVAIGLKKSVSCKRIGVSVVGLEVPHAHIHLIPFHEMREMNMSNAPLQLSKEEMQTLAENISKNIVL
jgi:histidine triad (HIT) family protein